MRQPRREDGTVLCLRRMRQPHVAAQAAGGLAGEGEAKPTAVARPCRHALDEDPLAVGLGDPVTGPLTEKQQEYLSYITVSTNALLAIINNILDLATIDAGAMALNLGPVDIRRTMDAAAEGVQDRLVKNGIKLELRVAQDIGSFLADERRVRQSLFNLLANAVGFSPAGEVVVFAAKRAREAVVFSVTDRGPGIPTEQLEKVFDPFTRLEESRNRETGGIGLGLALARAIVRDAGGDISLAAREGGGLVATIGLPRG